MTYWQRSLSRTAAPQNVPICTGCGFLTAEGPPSFGDHARSRSHPPEVVVGSLWELLRAAPGRYPGGWPTGYVLTAACVGSTFTPIPHVTFITFKGVQLSDLNTSSAVTTFQEGPS